MQHTSYFKNPFSRIYPPRLLLPFAIAGILIILISTFLEYRSRRDDYSRLLENQAFLFLETIVNASHNTLEAANVIEDEINQRILSNLQLFAQLKSSPTPSDAELFEFIEYSHFQALQIYDGQGQLLKHVPVDDAPRIAVPGDLVTAVADQEFHELFIDLEDPSNAQKQHLAALVRGPDGIVLAGIVSAEQIGSFRRLYGFGRFLQGFQKEEGVEYIVLQNDETIIAGLFEGYSISSFSTDPFLSNAFTSENIQSRINLTAMPGQSIFEAIAPFHISGEPVGVLRLGLSMQLYDQLNDRVKKRMVIFGIVLLVLIFILMNFALTYRHRQLLQNDLNRLRDYTNVILDNLGTGVITVDKDRTIQVVNKRGGILLHRDFSQLYNASYTALPQPLQEAVDKGLDGGTEMHHPLHFSYQVDQQVREFALRTSLTDFQQESAQCILMLDDITEQTRLEAQVRQQDKLTLMGKLASTVAHEIRNPLNSIHLIVQLLKKKFAPAENVEQYDQYATSVESEISRINDIVNNFIEYARPPTLKPESIDFPQFFSDIQTLFQARMDEAGHTLFIQGKPHDILHADRAQLRQVFVNLIENAIQAMDIPGTLTIRGMPVHNSYEISVTDTGSGIPAEDIDKIFELYFTRKQQGTGVGLAVVHQIITRHKGTIQVRSDAGKGTTFLIRLPIE